MVEEKVFSEKTLSPVLGHLLALAPARKGYLPPSVADPVPGVGTRWTLIGGWAEMIDIAWSQIRQSLYQSGVVPGTILDADSLLAAHRSLSAALAFEAKATTEVDEWRWMRAQELRRESRSLLETRDYLLDTDADGQADGRARAPAYLTG